MKVETHPTAIIDPGSKLGENVKVGPYSIIGPGVEIGSGTIIDSHAVIVKNTIIGKDCKVFSGAVVGGDPQDLKFKGRDTYLCIGDRTVIREYATLSRGTEENISTKVGSNCFLMAYVHIAHDCVIGDNVILSNAVNMAGHVTIEDYAIVGGLAPIHQFVRIGCHSFIGGGSRVPKDLPPYLLAAGNPLVLAGTNSVGLQRRGFPVEVRQELKRAYKLIFRSKLNIQQALEKARTELHPYKEILYLIEFIESSERGITI